jgi:hypothetical protein
MLTEAVPQVVAPLLAVMVGLAADSSPYHLVAVPVPLVKLTLAVPPGMPLPVLKNPLPDDVVNDSVVVPVLVVGLPYWSSSWKLSWMSVVELADAEVGLGVIATWAAGPATLVSEKSTVLVPGALAVIW